MTNSNNGSNIIHLPTQQFLSESASGARELLKKYLVELCSTVRDHEERDFFNICELADLTRLKSASICLENSDFDESSVRNGISYRVLSAHHCIHYERFSIDMKRLLPEVVIDALGYDHESLARFLGEDGYAEVVAAINSPILTKEEKQAAKESAAATTKKTTGVLGSLKAALQKAWSGVCALAVVAIFAAGLFWFGKQLFELGTKEMSAQMSQMQSFEESVDQIGSGSTRLKDDMDELRRPPRVLYDDEAVQLTKRFIEEAESEAIRRIEGDRADDIVQKISTRKDEEPTSTPSGSIGTDQ